MQDKFIIIGIEDECQSRLAIYDASGETPPAVHLLVEGQINPGDGFTDDCQHGARIPIAALPELLVALESCLGIKSDRIKEICDGAPAEIGTIHKILTRAYRDLRKIIESLPGEIIRKAGPQISTECLDKLDEIEDILLSPRSFLTAFEAQIRATLHYSELLEGTHEKLVMILGRLNNITYDNLEDIQKDIDALFNWISGFRKSTGDFTLRLSSSEISDDREARK